MKRSTVLYFFLFFICHADLSGKSVSNFHIHNLLFAHQSDTSAVHSEPYSSGKSVGGHILSFPSTLFDWATRPIGFSMRKAEKVVPDLFAGERGSYGIFPLVELGGATGYSYGFLLFHKNLLHPSHDIRIEALFGSRSYNDFDLDYAINDFISEKATLIFDASYANRPERTLLFGNDALLEERSFYDREDLQAAIQLNYHLSEKTSVIFRSDYLSRRISRSDIEQKQDEVDPFTLFPESLIGNTSLISFGSEMVFDAAAGRPRIKSGTRLIASVEWSRSLTNSRFHYLLYGLELNQFAPLPFLPDSRRLAFKAHLRKAEALQGKEIPFFEFPSLGSSRDLRGFSTDRFRDDGSLLFTAEYRYPIWNFADVVLFVDEGQVFNHFSDIGLNKFQTGYGFGFHLISAKGFAFRSEFAFSRETSRFILLISPNF